MPRKPIFTNIPDWLNVYHPGKITANNPQFHYYLSPSQQDQAVTLYIPEEDDKHKRIKMYYNLERIFLEEEREKDTSQIKDFKYLEGCEADEHNKIVVSRDNAVHDSSWVRKYEPHSFIDLLTDELHNRNVVTWLKSWDQIVFKKTVHKIETVPSLFRKFTSKGTSSNFTHDLNYKKLILLAGPPGCGKTTLARVAAKHCGYTWQQINASDDRTGKALISKIDNLVSNKTIRKQQKPTCVIIDEVDGALDRDQNGIKDVLRYLETGEINGNQFKEKSAKDANKGKEEKKQPYVKRDKYNRHRSQPKQADAVVIQEKRKTKIDRPVIFICNDPFVKGLKELRNKAVVIYFNTLQEDRVVKRLKEITDNEGQYIESDVLAKICQICNNDVRSSVSILELVVGLKRQQHVSAKQIIDKLRLSFTKDVNSSTNQFLGKVMQSQVKLSVQKDLFKNYRYFLSQHQNQTLLKQTFYHNLLNLKSIFLKMDCTTRLYRELVTSDVLEKQSFALHLNTDQFNIFPYVYYRLNFRAEEHKKIEFPFPFFERLTKQKMNNGLLQKLIKALPSKIALFINPTAFIKDYLYLFWLTMQTSSNREQDVLKCVYKILTYGIKLSNRHSPFLFSPQFDQLLTFGQNKPQITMSNTSRTLMQQNYEFLKLKVSLAGDALLDTGKQNLQTVINQLKKNRKRKRDSLHGIVKYKYLQGTGTQIKYDLKIKHFFEQKQHE